MSVQWPRLHATRKLSTSVDAAGWAYSPYFMELLEGVQNALALRHVPEVAPRQDWFAGSEGRRADKVRPALSAFPFVPALVSDMRHAMAAIINSLAIHW